MLTGKAAPGTVMEREFSSLHQTIRSIHGGVTHGWGIQQDTLEIRALQAGQSEQEGYKERLFTWKSTPVTGNVLQVTLYAFGNIFI